MEEQAKDEEFKERSVDKLSSQDTGSLLYDLRTIEKGWSYEQSKSKQNTATSGVREIYIILLFQFDFY